MSSDSATQDRAARSGVAARAHRVRAGAVSLDVLEWGAADAPPVVLLHGFPEAAFTWSRIAVPLADAGFRVLAPDQRGYARSDKPRGRGAYRLALLAADVIGLADALRIGRVDVVGHDWGALVAWHLGSRHAPRVRRTMIVNGPHPRAMRAHALRHPTQIARSLYIAGFQAPLVPEWAMRAHDHALLARALVASSRPGTFDDAMLARYRAAWSVPGALGAMLAWYRAMPLYGADDAVGRVPGPVHIAWGDRDRFLESALAEASATYCDDARITHFTDATHWLHHEQPEALVRLLLAFLA